MSEPTITQVGRAMWECTGAGVSRRGNSPDYARRRWEAAAANGKLRRPAKPRDRMPPAPQQWPDEPFRGQVTVLHGTAPRPALRMPMAMRLAAERAAAVQPPMRSIEGGRGE